jgi:hypothetical protein
LYPPKNRIAVSVATPEGQNNVVSYHFDRS